MKFTDLFINKPVLAVVVSLLILVLGVRAVSSLSVRQYPKTENATVTVTTAYYGADAQTMAGFVTQPLEQAISQAQGTATSGLVVGILGVILALVAILLLLKMRSQSMSGGRGGGSSSHSQFKVGESDAPKPADRVYMTETNPLRQDDKDEKRL